MGGLVWRAHARPIPPHQRAGADRIRHSVRLWLVTASPNGFAPDFGETLANPSRIRNRLDRDELPPYPFAYLLGRALDTDQHRHDEARQRRLLRVGDLDYDLRGNRPRATLHVRLQSHAALPRRCILLALSDPPADCGGAAGRGVPPPLALADQVRDHSRSCPPRDVGELSSTGTLHLHRHCAEWPSLPPRQNARRRQRFRRDLMRQGARRARLDERQTASVAIFLPAP